MLGKRNRTLELESPVEIRSSLRVLQLRAMVKAIETLKLFQNRVESAESDLEELTAEESSDYVFVGPINMCLHCRNA